MSSPIDKSKLIEILKEVDKKLKSPLVLIAIGGTGLNLIGLKNETLDLDFIIENDNTLLKADVIVTIYNMGYETQIQDRGTIVMYKLPSDYLENSTFSDINKNFKNLRILVLWPLDILISKIGRYELKDRIDIEQILNRYKYPLILIEARFKEFYKHYQGNKPNFVANFNEFKKQYYTLFPAQ